MRKSKTVILLDKIRGESEEEDTETLFGIICKQENIISDGKPRATNRSIEVEKKQKKQQKKKSISTALERKYDFRILGLTYNNTVRGILV